MVDKKIGLRLMVILILGAILSTACVQSYSKAPAATPTLIPTGLFAFPLSTEEEMTQVADFGTQTLIAQTAEANGGTPSTPEVVITPLSGSSTPAVVVTFTPAPVTNTISAATYAAPGGVPATYTLQQDEFLYCIARRYNVDPGELGSLNGIRDWEVVQPGLVLQMPQTGDPFPGMRALHNHPDTYTVTGNGDTTIYGVACYYGDVTPQAIAQANNLSLSTVLMAGQQLRIP